MNLNQIQSTVRKKKITAVIGSVLNSQSGGGGGNIISVSGTTNQITVSPTTGAVVISLPNAVAFPGAWSIGTLGYSDTGILWSAQSSLNSYNQAILQNTSNGATASTNFNVSNDQGTATTNFGEFGINSSGFTGTSSFSVAGNVYLASGSTDLVIGTYASKSLRFVTNSATTDNLSISGAGVFTYNIPTNGSVYTSTWTATANNQSAFEWTGTVTSRNTASDTFNYLVIDPTLARNAGNPATQTATAVLINPTFSNSPTTQYILRLQNANTDRFNFESAGILSINSDIGQIAVATIGRSNSNLSFQTGSTTRMSMNSNGQVAIGTVGAAAHLYIAQPVMSISQVPALRVDPGSHTSMAAGTEFKVNFFQSSSQTWSNGSATLALQRYTHFAAPTVNAGSGNTITDTFTVSIDDPINGTGVTTNLWSFGAGKAKFTGNRILMTGLPTSASGLPTGALWNNSNVINIAP